MASFTQAVTSAASQAGQQIAQAAHKAVQVAQDTPSWANWSIIGGGAAASWLAPVASFVAIVWGCLQIYGWFEKRIKDKRAGK